MDRSLVQTERSRSGIATRRGIGTTMTKPMTQPHNGTVVALPHWRYTKLDADAHGAWEPKESLAVYVGGSRRFPRRTNPIAVPMELVCTRRTLPAADVTRNRPSQRPFDSNATNTHAPRSS
jgi:hypothetical protein